MEGRGGGAGTLNVCVLSRPEGMEGQFLRRLKL